MEKEAKRLIKAMENFTRATLAIPTPLVRPKLKIEYQGISGQFGYHLIALHVTFTATGAQGTMYVSPDALPYKYGME